MELDLQPGSLFLSPQLLGARTGKSDLGTGTEGWNCDRNWTLKPGTGTGDWNWELEQGTDNWNWELATGN